MKSSKLITILLALMALTPMAWAQVLSGSGTTEDPYLINNNADWETFAQSINGGTTYAEQFVKLTADIATSVMVGNSSHPFSGTFDGQGHTLTVSLTANATYCAPFSFAGGATFQNLKVGGTINTSKKFCAGFVGAIINSSCTFSNCVCDVTINSSINGDGTHGGFVGYAAQGANTFEGCAFTGKLLGADTYYVGGFVGYTETNNGATVAFTNCLFHPSQVTIGTNGGQTFARWRSGNSSVIIGDNCYYSQIPATARARVGMTWLLGYEP